jgi:mono/diheme cytochrome c family protein
MLRRLILSFAGLALLGGVLLWGLTVPRRVDASLVRDNTGDLQNGRTVFAAAGCGSCHAQTGQPNALLLGGGLRLSSPFGTFTVPNISPDPDAGIGRWTPEEFATALLAGTAPDNSHLYPAFPYTSYRRMKPGDVRDLRAFINTLPPSTNRPAGHDFPLNLAAVRRGVGLWKQLYFRDAASHPDGRDVTGRGAYLVETLGHCAECHSPRDVFGGVVADRRFGGDGSRAPNITPGMGGIGDWSAEDIAFMLEDGSTPGGDVVGREMAEVVKNTAQLSAEDRAEMARYVKELHAVDSIVKEAPR